MDSLTTFLEKYFLPVAATIGEQRHLLAVRNGIVSLVPLILIGSFFLIVAFPPLESLAAFTRPHIQQILLPFRCTMGLMGLFASFSVAYNLAQSYKMDTLASGMISTACFFVASPLKDGNINTELMSSQGLFLAIIIALLTVEITRFFNDRDFVIKMPAGVPPTVFRCFAALIPAFACISLLWIINVLLGSWQQDLHKIISLIITTPLMGLGGTLPAMLIATFCIQLFWCMGLHGDSLVFTIISPILLAFSEQNAAAMAAGQPLPHIINAQFYQLFITIGGSGLTLSLATLMILFARSGQLKAIGKTGFIPGLFNINEPMIFGTPIVLNPIMWIPFVIAPLLTTVLTYYAMASGLVGLPYAMVPWTTPLGIGAWLATGDWKAGVLGIIIFVISGIIYYPFFRIYDKQLIKQEIMVENQ